MKIDKTQILLENKDIFIAALNEFSKNSYSESSINEIIKNSKVNKGSFYYRFSNKEELFIAMMDYIIVIQIDLFNNRKINLAALNDLNEIIYELFFNMYLLFKEDNRYFQIISNHLKNKESLSIIENNCVSPIKTRFFLKIGEFKANLNYEYIIVLLESLYHNFPIIMFESENFKLDLKNFVDFIISSNNNHNITLRNNFVRLETTHFNDQVNFLLSENSVNFIYSGFYSLTSAYDNFPLNKKSLAKSLGILMFTYKNVINKLIKTNLKNPSYFNVFKKESILNLARKNYRFEKLLITLAYLIAKEEQNIVVDGILDTFSQEEKEVFFMDILPILSKTSKILVNNVAFKISYPIKKIYYFDLSGKLEVIEKSALTRILNKYIRVILIKNDDEQVLYLEKNQLSKLNEMDLKDIKDISLVNEIKYIDLINREVDQ